MILSGCFNSTIILSYMSNKAFLMLEEVILQFFLLHTKFEVHILVLDLNDEHTSHIIPGRPALY